MIVVVGWPRSGTSLLMQILEAGGLDPVIGPYAREPRPFNRNGVWEIPRVRYAVQERIDDPNAVIKVFHRPLTLLLEAGIVPAGAVMSVRDPVLVSASAAALWTARPVQKPEYLERIRVNTLRALEAADVPVVEVDPAVLVDKPEKESLRIATELEPVLGRLLDVAAMSRVPDPGELHHR